MKLWVAGSVSSDNTALRAQLLKVSGTLSALEIKDPGWAQ